VQSFPVAGDRYQVSVPGAYDGPTVPGPVWLERGRRFTYLGADGVS
jgi:hypothetical protein